MVMKTKYWIALLALAAGPIGVLASDDTDRKIEDAARNSYAYRTVLAGKVDVSSQDGVVTLTGKVEDDDNRNLAEATVTQLPGVVRVDDQIQVVPAAPEHSDPWIALKIRSVLLVKAHVSAATTTVDVNQGVVTLGGTASSEAERELAEEYARDVDGVKSVRNNIIVGTAPGETLGATVDDASITGELKLELLSHKATSALRTKVETSEGTVTITGEADSEAERDLVTMLAETLRGVKHVDNRMTIRGVAVN